MKKKNDCFKDLSLLPDSSVMCGMPLSCQIPPINQTPPVNQMPAVNQMPMMPPPAIDYMTYDEWKKKENASKESELIPGGNHTFIHAENLYLDGNVYRKKVTTTKRTFLLLLTSVLTLVILFFSLTSVIGMLTGPLGLPLFEAAEMNSNNTTELGLVEFIQFFSKKGVFYTNFKNEILSYVLIVTSVLIPIFSFLIMIISLVAACTYQDPQSMPRGKGIMVFLNILIFVLSVTSIVCGSLIGASSFELRGALLFILFKPVFCQAGIGIIAIVICSFLCLFTTIFSYKTIKNQEKADDYTLVQEALNQ